MIPLLSPESVDHLFWLLLGVFLTIGLPFAFLLIGCLFDWIKERNL